MSIEKILELEAAADQLRNEQKYDEAISKTREILEIDEAFPRAHLTLAVLYHHVGDYEKACQHAERAVELEPNDPFNMAALSETYRRAFEGTRDPIYIQKAETALARGQGF